MTNTDLVQAGKAWEWLKEQTAEELAQVAFECVVDGHNGIYCAQTFAERFPRSNMSKENWLILKKGPYASFYYDTWNNVTDNWEHEAYRIHLGESGDVFVYDENVINMWEAATSKTVDSDFWEEWGH